MKKYKTINLDEFDVQERHHILTSSIVPRPIAWASTINMKGEVNLSPFSYFNIFGVNPPILVFSPNLRGRDATVKDTLQNVREVPEVVINIVTVELAEEMNMTSAMVDPSVNEFELAGLTEQASIKVRPPRVLESPIQLECKVNDIIALGDQGAAGNLVICEVVLLHIDESILDHQMHIDPSKINFLSRGGGDDYYKATVENIFRMKKEN